jgi:lysophospholipase L1-like esterase
LVKSKLKINVINSGIGGDTSGGLLSRFYPGVVQYHPDVVLIMGGTNDLWWDLDIKMILANIFAMTCQAEHHDIVPLVGLPVPIIVEKACEQEFAAPESGYDRCAEKLAALAKTLARAAQQNDIACLDFYHPFCDKSGKAIGKYFLDDGLHPNEAGHRLMAEITVKMLRERFDFERNG